MSFGVHSWFYYFVDVILLFQHVPKYFIERESGAGTSAEAQTAPEVGAQRRVPPLEEAQRAPGVERLLREVVQETGPTGAATPGKVFPELWHPERVLGLGWGSVRPESTAEIERFHQQC